MKCKNKQLINREKIKKSKIAIQEDEDEQIDDYLKVIIKLKIFSWTIRSLISIHTKIQRSWK